MGDAEIIPIGTRGRPGRGQGSGKPSSASRSLAAGARKTAPRRTTAAAGRADAPAEPDAHRRAAEPTASRPPRRRRAPAYAEERLPAGGIPAGDWLAAFQHAARELFGDQWEPQLARFLAFLRRRVSGDYVVDEYGFDPEVTERFFIAALRPIAEKWFRDRGPRHREHPRRGRRAGGLQPLRHASRSTG